MRCVMSHLHTGRLTTMPDLVPFEWESYVLLIAKVAAVVSLRGMAPIMKCYE